ncbi:macrophage mannose receptor 1-like [Etheostoma cragini]|uniref:macrophage mannose receptor 1-like n=1 Tax=Etheostoma cragini TaxID=417921 RepID=UPI00155EFFA4|nr:macrophage mannose receptor 1-like [Etheostoma cragini]
MKRNPRDKTEDIIDAVYANAPARTVNKIAAPPEKVIEEASYGNAPACTVDKVAAPPDQRSLFFSRSFPLIAVCWLILLVIMGLRIYFDTVVESKITNLTADVQNMTTRIKHLETQRNNLTELIRALKTNWNKLNVGRAQWSIDAYCPKTTNGRQCTACQNGWFPYGSNCYAYNNAVPPDPKTWEEARQVCAGRSSDLVVVQSQADQGALNAFSVGSSGTDGYWFGLRAEGGRWKWIDGSYLNESYWTPQPPPAATDGQCVMSVQNYKWISVSCGDRKHWICIMKALSV